VIPPLRIVSVYVPTVPTDPTGWHGIAPGSAIVGTVQGPLIRLDYEGGIYNPAMPFDEMLMHAADRHTWNNGRGYPTVARVWLDPTAVREVGVYHIDTDTLIVYEPDTLEAWKSLRGTQSV
jgi:hypothetical protein